MTKHDRIQREIMSVCESIGITAIQEFRGKGWRADVFVPNNNHPIAFEIQLSPQTLKKTLERQAKYTNDKILGCWLFENPVHKLNVERPDLPLFYVEGEDQSQLQVNLGDRRKIHLKTFLENFIASKIQFKEVAKTRKVQPVTLVFFHMSCWKCQTLNNLYYVETPFYAACNAKIRPDEALWESNSREYRPDIIAVAKGFADSRPELDLKLADIKVRHSNMVGHSYTSFGCYKCDSIFGDWYVMDAKMDVMYGEEKLKHEGEIILDNMLEVPIPHWCLPDGGEFCC